MRSHRPQESCTAAPSAVGPKKMCRRNRSGSLGSAYRLQGRAPRDHLFEHLLQRGVVTGGWLEDRKILEVVKHRQRYLGPYVGDRQLGHDQTEVLDPAHAPRASVADKACGL